MNEDVRSDLLRSRRDLEGVVWPTIRLFCGGGDLVVLEGSQHRTDRDLDVLAGIDAYQRTARGIRGFASRVQWTERSYDTFTVRRERLGRSSLPIQEEHKRSASLDPAAGLIAPALCLQAYLDKPGGELLAVAIIEARALYRHLEECARHHDGFARTRVSAGHIPRCYHETVDHHGAARFVVAPWKHLIATGVRVDIIRGPQASWTFELN